MDELWLIILSAMVGVTCSLVGVFLTLRRLSMMGDAISHTVLFGVVIGFILTSTWAAPVMFFFSVLAGVLTAFLSQFLSERSLTSGDSSIGVVFTFLFACSIIILSMNLEGAHIDLECVLFGDLAFQTFNTLELGGVDLGPKAFWSLLLLLVFEVVFLFFSFRALKVTSFDKSLAFTMGFGLTLIHYILMAVVSLVTVVNLELVGAILVVAMLSVPANAAFLFSRSVGGMIAGSVLFSIVSAVIGVWMSYYFDASPASSVALASGLCLMVLVILKKFLFLPARSNPLPGIGLD